MDLLINGMNQTYKFHLMCAQLDRKVNKSKNYDGLFVPGRLPYAGKALNLSARCHGNVARAVLRCQISFFSQWLLFSAAVVIQINNSGSQVR